MIRTTSLTAALAALAMTPAAMADDTGGTENEGTPVKLVSFDGELELLQKSSRMRVWRSHLAYTLTVDSDGNVTDCELAKPFRQRYVSMELCKLLSESHTFEPARDADDNEVAGTYSNRISYMDLREKY